MIKIDGARYNTTAVDLQFQYKTIVIYFIYSYRVNIFERLNQALNKFNY